MGVLNLGGTLKLHVEPENARIRAPPGSVVHGALAVCFSEAPQGLPMHSRVMSQGSGSLGTLLKCRL